MLFRSEPAPQFATVNDGKAIQVKFADGRTDVITLAEGAATLVTEQAGRRTVTDLAGGH